jgi:hypothetical protein
LPGSEPLPKNQVTKSGDTGVIVRAVPLPFSMICSSGVESSPSPRRQHALENRSSIERFDRQGVCTVA